MDEATEYHTQTFPIAGRYSTSPDRQFARWIGVRECIFTKSPASANLAALAALSSAELGDRRLRPGDEVITIAGATSIAKAILHNGLIPVLVDVTIPTCNVDVSQLEAALSPRTRAMIFPHVLGNPFDLGVVTACARTHNLWLIEDCGAAAGAEYRGRKTGTFGDLATLATNDGGAVLTSRTLLRHIVRSGREPESALRAGSPIANLDVFATTRRHNFKTLRDGLSGLEEFFILPEPTHGSAPCWLGFPIGIRPDAPFSRSQATALLQERNVPAGVLFADKSAPRCRVAVPLQNTDFIKNQFFWIALDPVVPAAMLDRALSALHTSALGRVMHA
jgi:CDP-4-dehydro-6-deoxyglucose reductase, E1